MPKILNELTAVAFVSALLTGTAAAQPDTAYSLGAKSSMVVLGSVKRTGASIEPMVKASPRTAVISIERMYAGSEIAGDKRGHSATVILSKPMTLRPGTKALFFGEPRFIGTEITIADAGEIQIGAADSAQLMRSLMAGVQARRDAPIRARLAIATLVARGTVERVEGLSDKRSLGEHDPEFQLAFVRVTGPLAGTERRAVIPVLFSASRDIAWFNSPKLRPGEDAIFIAHPPQESELALLRYSRAGEFVRSNGALLVTQPYDVLPVSEERRLANLVSTKEDR